MMSERAERANSLHEKGYNCAQAVACAYCDSSVWMKTRPTAWRRALVSAWA